VPASSRHLALLVPLSLWLLAPSAETANAQTHAPLRVEPFPTSVTASGHPMSAWVTVSNESERPMRVEVRAARSLDAREGTSTPVSLRIHGLEVADTRVDGVFVVAPHAHVRVVVFVGGFEGPARERYDVALDVCVEGGPCVEGHTHVSRAYRDPIRR
jgi:hypothetical protein